MRSFWNVFRTEKTWDIAREAAWRVVRAWRTSGLSQPASLPVRFRALPYYLPNARFLNEGDHAALLSVAQKAADGEVPVFAFGSKYLGDPPRWNVDVVSGAAWPQVESSQIRVVRHDGSDVKVPWEISRLQFLPVLAKAFRVTSQDRFREAATRWIDQWCLANPMGQGVNWTIAMEASLRAISLCLTLDLLMPLDEAEDPWLAEVSRALERHLSFIERHDEFSYFLTSNHYLSNVVARFVIAAHVDSPEAESMRGALWRKIETEMRRQVYADGGDYEASLGYHLLVTQLFTTAYRCAMLTSPPPSADFKQSLRRMYEFVAGLCDGQGRLPHIGDCDDGRVEWMLDDLSRMSGDATGQDALFCSDLRDLGCALFDKPSTQESYSAAWYGLPQRVAEPARPMVQWFQDTGIVRAGMGQAELWFAAVPNGINGKGSHTHNDKLSVLLTLAGQPLLVDSGTHTYTRDATLRNRFRSTRSHNTVLVDDTEQNEVSPDRSQLFRLGNQARVTLTVETESATRVALAGSHDGYNRIGVACSRRCELTPSGLQIVDDLTGSGIHRVELTYVVASPWQCVLGASEVTVSTGASRAIIKATAPCPLKIRTEPWKISRVYGGLTEATRVAILAETSLPVQIKTDISWE